MSFFQVRVTCEFNNNTFVLSPGINILGRNTKELGLENEQKKQLKVVVDVLAKKVTVERLAGNQSKRNKEPLPESQIVEIVNGDVITLVIDAYPCKFSIIDIPFSSDPATSQAQFSQLFSDTAPDEPQHPAPPPVKKRDRLSDENSDEHSRDSDIESEESDRVEGFKGRLWPEDFSDESDDIVGSGLDESSEKAEEPVFKKPKQELEPDMPPAAPKAKKRAAVSWIKSRKKEPWRAVRKASKGRRVTAYGLYAKEVRPQLKKDYPNSTTAELTKIIKARWFRLPDDEREPYETKAIENNSAVEEGDDGTDMSANDVDEKDNLPLRTRAKRSRASRASAGSYAADMDIVKEESEADGDDNSRENEGGDGEEVNGTENRRGTTSNRRARGTLMESDSENATSGRVDTSSLRQDEGFDLEFCGTMQPQSNPPPISKGTLASSEDDEAHHSAPIDRHEIATPRTSFQSLPGPKQRNLLAQSDDDSDTE